MKIFYILFILLIINIYTLTSFLHQVLTTSNHNVLGVHKTKYQIKNSVSIGEYRFSLFGYTSPHALVTIEGMGVYDQTNADENGYFVFKNSFSPLSSREACLTAQDQLGRLTNPTCLPPFPTDYDIAIGPVIIPPTTSFDKNDYFIGDEVILSGQTIPNTEIKLSLFTNDKGTRSLSFNKPVYAFSFPELTAKSDDKGNYAIQLPSSNAKTFRLFTQVEYEKTFSPQGLVLQLKILPLWMIIIKILLIIWNVIKPRLLEISIITEIIVLAWFFYKHYFNFHTIAKNKSIVLRNQKFHTSPLHSS